MCTALNLELVVLRGLDKAKRPTDLLCLEVPTQVLEVLLYSCPDFVTYLHGVSVDFIRRHCGRRLSAL